MKPQLNFWKSSFKRKYEKLNMIKWNEWYHFMYPKVEYWIDGHRKYPNLQFRVPNRYQKDELWKEVKSNNFENVNYKFIDVSDNCSSIDVNLGECDFLSNVILNGFILNENLLFKKIWGLPKESVICSIIDDKNLLQLDLSRKQINYKDDIFDTINIEIWKWQIASLLCCNIPNVRLKKGNKRQKLEAYNFKNDYPDGLLLGKNGFSFWQPYFMRMLNLDKVYVLKNPIVTNKENVSIQSYITDSDIPILIFRNDSFRNQLEKEYEKCKRKCDHIFDLLKLDKVQWNTKAKYMEFISALFFEGEDLWIPYDFLQRREKFPTAFNVLKNYTTNNEWILSSKIYRKNTYTSYRDINKYDIRQLYSFLENGD